MPALPIVALEIQDAAVSSPYAPLTDSQWKYLGGDIFALNPTIAGQVTGIVRSMSIQRGKQQSLNRFEAGTLTADLDNRNGALDPQNTSSPFAPYIAAESRIRARAWYNRLLLGQVQCSDVNGFYLSNCSVAENTTVTARLPGLASLAMTASAAGGMYVAARYGTDQAITPWNNTIGCPVTPGETVTAILSFMAATTARTCQIVLNFYTTNLTLLATHTVNIVDATTGWTDDNLTAIAPAGATYAILFAQVLSAAAGEVHYIGALGFWGGTDKTVQMSTLIPVEAQFGSNAMAIPLFYGTADSFELSYPQGGMDAVCRLTASDSFKRFAEERTRDYFAMAALSYAPTLYARLNDPVGSPQLTDSSGNAVGWWWRPEGSPIPTLGVTPTLNVGSSISSSSNKAVSFNSADSQYLELGSGNPVGATPTANIWSGTIAAATFVILFSSPAAQGAIASLYQQAGGTGNIQIGLNANGTPFFYYTDGTTAYGPYTLDGTVITNGIMHLLVVTLEQSGTSTLVNGYVAGSNTSGQITIPAVLDVSGGSTVLANNTPGVAQPFNGIIDEFAVYTTALTAADVTALYDSLTSLDGAGTGGAVQNLLGTVGWGLPIYESDVGTYTIGPLDDMATGNLLDVLNNKIMVTEYGALFQHADGTMVFLSHNFIAGNTTVAATFTDASTDAAYGISHIPYADIQRVEDQQLVVNDVTLSWHGDMDTGAVAYSWEFADESSINSYGVHTASLDSYAYQNFPFAFGQWYATHFATPKVRFPAISVDLLSFPAVAAAALTCKLMDYITVVQTPPGCAQRTDNPLIIHIEDQIGPGTWTRHFIADTLDAG